MNKVINNLKRIKGVYLRFSIFLSNNLFYSSTYLFKILKTLLLNVIFRLENDYVPYPSNIKCNKKDMDKIKSLFDNDKNLNIVNSFYSVQTLDYIPNFYQEILKKNRTDIEKYLGKKFKYEDIILTRKKKIPKSMENQEFYNNTWHQDSDTYKQLRIFFLVDPVSIEDGPFTYLSLADTKTYWWKIKKDKIGENSTLNFNEQLTFTGDRGAYLVVDPSRRLHRASNPKTDRYMFSMTLYPNWEKNTTGVERFDWVY